MFCLLIYFTAAYSRCMVCVPLLLGSWKLLRWLPRTWQRWDDSRRAAPRYASRPRLLVLRSLRQSDLLTWSVDYVSPKRSRISGKQRVQNITTNMHYTRQKLRPTVEADIYIQTCVHSAKDQSLHPIVKSKHYTLGRNVTGRTLDGSFHSGRLESGMSKIRHSVILSYTQCSHADIGYVGRP